MDIISAELDRVFRERQRTLDEALARLTRQIAQHTQLQRAGPCAMLPSASLLECNYHFGEELARIKCMMADQRQLHAMLCAMPPPAPSTPDS